jgi:PAS domain S-box-containing protein
MSAELLIRLPDYFSSLINAMQDGFVLRGTDGTVVEVNDAFCSMVCYERAEIVGGRPPHPWWPDESRDDYEQVFRRYLAGERATDDLLYQRRSGEHFPALVSNSPLRDSDGQIIGYIGTIKDMTERFSAETQMRVQAALIDQVQAGVVATDVSGNVVAWNRGAETLYGWTAAEVLGKPAQDILLGPDSEETVQALINAFNSGQPWEAQLEVPRRDGTTVQVLVTSSVVRDGRDRPAGIVGVLVDVTEQQRAEARLAAQYAVARSLSDAQTLREGLRGTLEAVGTHLDWQYGGFWIIDDALGIAECSETWNDGSEHGPRFDDICNRTRFEPGVGLPGIAWQQSSPLWIRDFATNDGLPRRAEFSTIGIRSAFAIPVRIGQQIVGVIEFLATEIRERDAELLAAMESIEKHVGQFIERKRAESALRESESRFRTMANSAPVLLWVAEANGDASWFNHGWLEYTGRTLEDELGEGWMDGVHPADIDAFLAIYRNALATREPFEVEFRLRRSDGEYCWIVERGGPRIDADGTFTGFIGSGLDISDRKRHEENQAFLSEATRVLASSLNYRETLTSVAQLAVPTIADWCVVHVVDDAGSINPLAVAHVDPEKVDWARQIQERYPARLDAPFGVPNVIRTGQPEVYSEIPDEALVAAAVDDEHLALIREVGLTSAMILPIIARGRVLGVISFASADLGRHYDESDLALAQHLARRAAVAIDNALLYAEAQQAAQARDQFLAVAAHELRSPLTSMKGFAQLLLRRAKRLPSGTEWITPLQTIDSQINRVTLLVNRLLDVSRIEEERLQLQCEPVDMVEVVRGAAVEAQLAAENHTVVARFSDDTLIANVDRTRIEQVLANLLDNAIKYSPEGTTVELVLTSNGDELVVDVVDEGPGIAAEAQARMFERYFRGTSSTRAASEGLGLGLYVAHGIVTAHGGQMRVMSEDGHGTTFSFSVPRELVDDASRADGEGA